MIKRAVIGAVALSVPLGLRLSPQSPASVDTVRLRPSSTSRSLTGTSPQWYTDNTAAAPTTPTTVRARS